MRCLADKRCRGAICLVLLAGTLVVGLWPFNPFPPNNVNWLGNHDGLRLGKTGVVYSPTNVQWPSPQDPAACTMELWVRPGTDHGSNVILTFYNPDAPERFKLFQWNDSTLLLYRDYHSQHTEMDIENALHDGSPMLITVAAGPGGTAVYLNGALAQASSRLLLSQQDFSGQLVLGTSPTSEDAWAGELYGLALYGKQLTAVEVSRHFAAWMSNGNPQADAADSPRAIYTFSERSGKVVRDRLGLAPVLYVPESFKVLHKTVLTAPWKEFQWNWSYAQDIVVNVGGFLPLGFCFYGYFLLTRNAKWATLATILSGTGVSFLIECLQVYLPTRTSSWTDVLANIAGTVLGIILCRSKTVQMVLGEIC